MPGKGAEEQAFWLIFWTLSGLFALALTLVAIAVALFVIERQSIPIAVRVATAACLGWLWLIAVWRIVQDALPGRKP